MPYEILEKHRDRDVIAAPLFQPPHSPISLSVTESQGLTLLYYDISSEKTGCWDVTPKVFRCLMVCIFYVELSQICKTAYDNRVLGVNI